MNILAALAKKELLQPHHLRAAIWYAELAPDHPARKAIAEQCLSVERWAPSIRINPLKLLISVVIENRPCELAEPSIGMLREALNACERARKQERFRG